MRKAYKLTYSINEYRWFYTKKFWLWVSEKEARNIMIKEVEENWGMLIKVIEIRKLTFMEYLLT